MQHSNLGETFISDRVCVIDTPHVIFSRNPKMCSIYCSSIDATYIFPQFLRDPAHMSLLVFFPGVDRELVHSDQQVISLSYWFCWRFIVA